MKLDYYQKIVLVSLIVSITLILILEVQLLIEVNTAKPFLPWDVFILQIIPMQVITMVECCFVFGVSRIRNDKVN